MPNADPAPERKPALVDVIHEWLGASGLRKRWGIEKFGDCGIPIPQGKLFLRENDVPYFTIWSYRVVDSGDHTMSKYCVSVYDPEFFTKLRKMLDEREASQTIVCRCAQCEGTKL